MTALLTTQLRGIELVARGKVRDLYAVADDLLLVATDRLSAFDHVLATGIPGKGKVLTQLSLFWFKFLEPIVANHLIKSDTDLYPPQLQPFAEQLDGRSSLVKRADMFPVECVVRGYLSGSGWKDYQATGSLCGMALPGGLRESDRLPEPLFTPASKSRHGEHDENISFRRMVELVGRADAERLRELSLALYTKAAKHAQQCGLILADTKFEFGRVGGEILLADEALTPDSSRYWPLESYAAGRAQASFDKQFVRDYLESVHWNKQAPAPSLPEAVVTKTQEKYLEAYRLLTGKTLSLSNEALAAHQT